MTHAPAARDGERQAVYDAEEAAFGGTTMDETLDWDEVEALLAAITTSAWFASLDIPVPTLVAARPGARRSSSDGTRIVVSEAGRDAATVIHEVAHHVDHHLHATTSAGSPPHGPGFRAASLRVAALVGGGTARHQLAEAFRRRRLAVAGWRAPEPDPVRPRALRGAIALPGPIGGVHTDETAPRVHTTPGSDVGCGDAGHRTGSSHPWGKYL